MNAPASNLSQSSLFDFLKNTNTRMTSKEIAAVTGKEHKHVMRDIKLLIDHGCLCESSFGLASNDVPMPRGGFRKEPIYTLDFNATIKLVTGYSDVLRSKVIDRWMELENQNGADLPTPQPTTPFNHTWRPFTYKPDLPVMVYTDSQGKHWFKARDVINALGYIGAFHTYSWIYSKGETIEVMTRGGDDPKNEPFVSASNLKRIVWRSGKEGRLPFLGWVRDVLFPAVGLSWLNVDKETLPAIVTPEPTYSPLTIEQTLQDRIANSRFLLSFGAKGEMMIEEVLGYRMGMKFHDVPVERIGMDTFFRRAELPQSVIAELPRV